MIVVHEDTAPAINVPEPYKRTLKVLLSPAIHPELQTLAVGMTILPPGGESDEHQHGEGEMFFVVSGTGCIKADKREEKLTAGTAIWAPPGDAHQLINNSSETLKVLWVLCPPGREASILEKAHQVTPTTATDREG